MARQLLMPRADDQIGGSMKFRSLSIVTAVILALTQFGKTVSDETENLEFFDFKLMA
jgi:hypothetical protein